KEQPMRQAPSLDLLRHEIRNDICRHCCYRTHAGEFDSGNERICEARCAIFHPIAEYLDPVIEPYEKALRHLYTELRQSPPADCDTRALHKYEEHLLR